MLKIKLHKLAAVLVLAAATAWVVSGEFSSVGSASADKETKAESESKKVQVLRTVAVVNAPHINHSRAIRISGLTAADKRASLATRSAGTIVSLPVRQGSSVKAGDVILSLDATDKQAAIEMARHLLLQREAEKTAAERLVERGNLAKLQADHARSALSAAHSQLQGAVAELDRMEIRAPFDGIVDRILVEKGSSILQGTEAAIVLSLDPIIASGEVSEHDLAYIDSGDPATARLVDGRVVEGTIRYISREASSQTRTFRVEVAIDNADRSIPAGMTAEITLLAEPVDAVMLPRSVVTLNHNGDLGIRAVGVDDQVVFYPIDLVDDTPKGLILAGIPEDAQIIIAGQDLVATGDRVDAVQADTDMIRKLVGDATGKIMN